MLKAITELRMMAISGYMPDLIACKGCSRLGHMLYHARLAQEAFVTKKITRLHMESRLCAFFIGSEERVDHDNWVSLGDELVQPFPLKQWFHFH